ncbi:MAG: hypothetical protein IJ489_09960 [Clostridia bacterium]|nr:hypothetical protein [Clostridia bacterium]
MISLLYRNSTPKKAPPLSTEALDSLMIDDAISLVIPENEKRNHFLKILSEPLIDTEDILYRQDILRDFLSHRFLLANLSDLFGAFVSVVLEYNKTRQNNKLTYRKAVGSLIDSGVSTLQSISVLIRELLLLLQKLDASIEGLPIHSTGLLALRNRLHTIAKSDAFPKLLSIAKKYDRFTAFHLHADIAFDLGENAQLTEIRLLSSVEEMPVSKPQKEPKKLHLFKKRDSDDRTETQEAVIPLNYNSFTTEKIVGQSISDITDAMIDVANQILSEFMGIKDDLLFYETACRILDKLKELETPYVFPLFGNQTEILDLYDLFLLFRSPDETNVIPNDFSLFQNIGGMLIRGDNGSGKTVYLRSVTTAYLFAQAGLPVLARKAFIVPICALHILMASSENTLDILGNAGRFEEEVIKISEIVNHPMSGAMVMLNEFFQTTSYAEGAQSLYHILQYLSAQHMRWICVTHLLDLFDLYRNEVNVTKIEIQNHKAKLFTS